MDKNLNVKIKVIDPKEYKGSIPTNAELVVFEKGDKGTAVVLLGFDEVETYNHGFKNPVYGFATYGKSDKGDYLHGVPNWG